MELQPRVSDWVAINRARHSDLHGLAGRRHHLLDRLDAARRLPADYGTMFVLALVAAR